MVSPDHVSQSKAIQRATGATFHLATRLLPERARHPTYVLYAFFRVADEVVDDPDPGPPAERRRTLELIRAGALGDGDARDTLRRRGDDETAAVLAAFDDLRREADIPDGEIDVFIDAMERDIAAEPYADHDDLSTYLRGSSVAVAEMMLAVMEPDDPEAARPHAKALAEAFQLTNFLRDVREDVVDYDRIYLPESSLAAHGLSPDDVRALEPTPALRATIADELERTETLYRQGVAGIELLPKACQPAVLLAAVLYAEHHRLVRERDYDVVTERPSLSMRRRLFLAARTWLAWKRSGDPEAVFYRVSAVDRDPEGAPAERPSAERQTPSLTRRPLARLARAVPWGRDR